MDKNQDKTPINDRIMAVLTASPTPMSSMAIAMAICDDRYSTQAIAGKLSHLRGKGLVECSTGKGNLQMWFPVVVKSGKKAAKPTLPPTVSMHPEMMPAPVEAAPVVIPDTSSTVESPALEVNLTEELAGEIRQLLTAPEQSAPCALCGGSGELTGLDNEPYTCIDCQGSGTPLPGITPAAAMVSLFEEGEQGYTVLGTQQDIEKLRAHIAFLMDRGTDVAEARRVASSSGALLAIEREQHRLTVDDLNGYHAYFVRLAEILDIPTDLPHLADVVVERVGNLEHQQQNGWLLDKERVNSPPGAPLKAHEFLVAAGGILFERAAQRDAAGGERSMAKAVAIFNAAKFPVVSPMSELDGWMFMMALKWARSLNSGGYCVDDYIDLAGYAALAGECHAREAHHA